MPFFLDLNFFNPVSASECEIEIKSLKNTKTDISTFPAKILKSYADILSPVLENLINKCFSKGDLPESFKVAIHNTKFKKGDTKLTSIYRPLSYLQYL